MEETIKIIKKAIFKKEIWWLAALAYIALC